jgi:hypothetical protein
MACRKIATRSISSFFLVAYAFTIDTQCHIMHGVICPLYPKLIIIIIDLRKLDIEAIGAWRIICSIRSNNEYCLWPWLCIILLY